MSSIPYVKKKIGDSYLIWFQNSNQYIQFKEPAWFVFRKTVNRSNTKTIAHEFATRYGIAADKSLLFVMDVQTEIDKLNHEHDQIHTENYTTEINQHIYTPFSIHRYKLGNHVIAFAYENQIFENYIHPLICHFEVEEEAEENYLFELFAFKSQIAFRFNHEGKGLWNRDETHLVKGLIYMYLINVMHDKTDEDWLMTIHASAITNNKKTILFSAAPGNGKTTIASLLQTRGYQLISDDFVPINKDTFSAYPFPIAISVKQGSVDLLSSVYPDLENKRLNYINPEKSVRYQAPNHHFDITKSIYPVREFIFVEYNPDVDFKLEKLDPIMAFKLLLDQVFVYQNKENVMSLFNHLLNISFYQLTYSNNQKALDAIAELFEGK